MRFSDQQIKDYGIQSMKSAAITLFCVLLFMLIGKLAYSEEIPEEIAVHCIKGEARLQFTLYGYDAFLSMAEALRNRGTTKGVYGCRKNWGRTPEQYKIDVAWVERYNATEEARRAWRESKHSNLVKGADHWEGIAFKEPDWAKGMMKTATIADTRFYLASSK